MKKTIALCILAVLLFTGCGQNHSMEEYIGLGKAMRIALDAASLYSGEVQFTEAELETSNPAYYRVEYLSQKGAHRYDIDALTGTVIDCQVDPPPDYIDPYETGVISYEEAVDIALNHAGFELTDDDVFIVSSSLWEVYRIEFLIRSDMTEYDYEIDPFTGEILSYDNDAEYYIPDDFVPCDVEA